MLDAAASPAETWAVGQGKAFPSRPPDMAGGHCEPGLRRPEWGAIAKAPSLPPPGSRWAKLGRAADTGLAFVYVCGFLKNLTHFCHVLVHQHSKGGGSVKNVLTRNFVRVPGSPGLLPLPPSPSVPQSLLPASTYPSSPLSVERRHNWRQRLGTLKMA